MNKSEQLIACLEGEIAKRDARIVELEGALLDANARLNGPPVSEAKAQGVVMPARKTKADYGVYIDEFADEAAAIYNAALDEVTRLNAAPVHQAAPSVSAMARILADRNADAYNVNHEDNWTIYGQDYIDDVTAMLAAALSAGHEPKQCT